MDKSSLIWQFEDYLRFASHQSDFVRIWAQNRLSVLYPTMAKRVMIKLLTDPNKETASASAIFLGDYGDKECGLSLLSCFKKSKDNNLSSNCAIALGKIGYEEAVPEMIKRLNQREIMRGIIEGLSMIKSQRAKKALINYFNDRSFFNKDIAYQCLLFHAILVYEDITLIRILVERYLAQPTKDWLMPFEEVIRLFDIVDILKSYSDNDLSKILKKTEGCFNVSLSDIQGCFADLFSKSKTSLNSLAEKLNQKANSFLIKNGYPLSEWETQRDNGIVLSRFEQGILNPLVLLSAFSSSTVRSKNRDEETAFEEALLLLSCYLRIVIDCETQKAIKKGQEQDLLFKIIERDEKYQTKMLINRIKENEKDAIKILLKVIKTSTSSWSTMEAIKSVGELIRDNPTEINSVIQVLVNRLKDSGDMVCKECVNTLRIIGSPVLKGVDKLLKKGNDLQTMRLLELIGDIPTLESVEILLDNADKLFLDFNKPFLVSLWKLCSKKAIPFLEQEYRQGEDYISETLLLHYEVNEIESSHLEELRKEYYEDRGKRYANDPLGNPLYLKLHCLNCFKFYSYEVEEIFYNLDGQNDETIDRYFIRKKIVCKNCQAVNQYKLTLEAILILSIEADKIVTMINMAIKNGENFHIEKMGRIRFVRFQSLYGEKMNPHQAILYYQKKIKKQPNNPLWRIRYGHALEFVGHTDEALEQYKKAIELDNTKIEAYINLGDIYQNMGNLSQSIQMYQKILDIANVKPIDENDKIIIETAKTRLKKLVSTRRKMMRNLSLPTPLSSQEIGQN